MMSPPFSIMSYPNYSLAQTVDLSEAEDLLLFFLGLIDPDRTPVGLVAAAFAMGVSRLVGNPTPLPEEEEEVIKDLLERAILLNTKGVMQ